MARKILFLISSLRSGGAERVAVNLANAWVERGDQIILVATYSKKEESFYTLPKNIELHYLADLIDNENRKGFLQQISRLLALRRLIKATQPDVVLSFLSNVNIAALIAAHWTKYPVIVSERAYPPMMPLGTFYEKLRKWIYPYAASIVMQTSKGQQWVIDNVPLGRSTVIPNSVVYPLVAFEPKLPVESIVSQDRKVLLAVGRLDEQKGFDYLLLAFAKLAKEHQNWDLIILGEGPIKQSLISQIQALELESRVHVLGRAGNVGDWYQRADLYVMSSRFEGFPNTLLEAMAHGCAVVSYDCDTGPRDIIQHEKNGLLVSPVGDVSALALALDRLMKNDAARQQMGQKAIEVREDYSLESIIMKWDKLFDDVIKK
ncbi:MAG: glycosyltransferase family 4 protein [Nitrosomonas sp.]